jgi:hypothetical protein
MTTVFAASVGIYMVRLYWKRADSGSELPAPHQTLRVRKALFSATHLAKEPEISSRLFQAYGSPVTGPEQQIKTVASPRSKCRRRHLACRRPGQSCPTIDAFDRGSERSPPAGRKSQAVAGRQKRACGNCAPQRVYAHYDRKGERRSLPEK